MMYVWGHSYEFTDHDNWEVMENFCRRMGGREDIWYASNIEIVDYMEATGRLQFGAGGDMVYNPSAASLWIEVDGGKREVTVSYTHLDVYKRQIRYRVRWRFISRTRTFLCSLLLLVFTAIC